MVCRNRLSLRIPQRAPSRSMARRMSSKPASILAFSSATSVLSPATSVLSPATSVLSSATSVLSSATSVLSSATSVLSPATSVLSSATSFSMRSSRGRHAQELVGQQGAQQQPLSPRVGLQLGDDAGYQGLGVHLFGYRFAHHRTVLPAGGVVKAERCPHRNRPAACRHSSARCCAAPCFRPCSRPCSMPCSRPVSGFPLPSDRSSPATSHVPDGSALPGWLSFDGHVTFSGTPLEADTPAVLDIVVTVGDDASPPAVDTTSFTLTVVEGQRRAGVRGGGRPTGRRPRTCRSATGAGGGRPRRRRAHLRRARGRRPVAGLADLRSGDPHLQRHAAGRRRRGPPGSSR